MTVDAGRLAELMSLTDSDRWRTGGSCDDQAAWIVDMLDRDPDEQLVSRFTVGIAVRADQWAARHRASSEEAPARFRDLIDDDAVMTAVAENVPFLDELDHDVTVEWAKEPAPATAAAEGPRPETAPDTDALDAAAWQMYVANCRRNGTEPLESFRWVPEATQEWLREAAAAVVSAYLDEKATG